MIQDDFCYGFEVIGATVRPRTLVNANEVFAHAARRASPDGRDKPTYLSDFRFGHDFADHVSATGTTAGFFGPCWAEWAWIEVATVGTLSVRQLGAVSLVDHIVERFGIEPDKLLIFLAGATFQIGVPTALWSPSPGVDFHERIGRFVEQLGMDAEVAVDHRCYARMRFSWLPNSRISNSDRYKRRIAFDELLGPLAPIQDLAGRPKAFDIPVIANTHPAAEALWAYTAPRRVVMAIGRSVAQSAVRVQEGATT